MQELVPISLYGINADKPASELPLDIYSNGSNIKFDDDYVSKVKGYSSAYIPSVAPLHVMNIVSGAISYWIYAGLTKIYVEDGLGGGSPYDLTKVYSVSTTQQIRWTSNYFNGLPILNPKNANPVYWDLNTANDVQAIPGWVAGDKCDVLRSFKNYLIAINVTTGGAKNNNLIKWSSRASAGSLPSTWTPASTNAAGDHEFSDTDDILIDGLRLKDYFVIYKQNSCYMMQEVGGQYIFQFFDLFSEFGALAEGCVVAFENKHAVLTVDDFIVHDGNTFKSTIDSRMKKYLFNNINQDYIDDCHLAHDINNNEILICYTDTNGTIPNKALVWNYREDEWYPPRDIPESYKIANGIYSGNVNDTWDADTQVWNDDITTWDQKLYSAVNDSLIAAGWTDIDLFTFDPNIFTFDNSQYLSYIERESLPIGNDKNMKIVSEIWPDIRAANGSIFTISVGFQQIQNDPIEWKNFTYIVGTHKKADIYGKGRYISLKIADDGQSYWKMGKTLKMNIGDAGKF